MKASVAAFQIDEPPEVGGRALRVLLVDRDPASLASTSSWLERTSGVELFAFSSAEQALTQSHGDRYDLCLLDFRLEGVNGVMLGAMIRALNPGARMLLMSDTLAPQVVSKALEHGFQAVISKPVIEQQLEQLLGARISAR